MVKQISNLPKLFCILFHHVESYNTNCCILLAPSQLTNFILPLLMAIEQVTCANIFFVYLLLYTVLWRSSFRFSTMQFYLLRFSSGMYYLHPQGDSIGSGGC